MINTTSLDKDEQLLYKRLIEQNNRVIAQRKTDFSRFLSPREQLIAQAAVGCNADSFFGGFENAQRKMLGFFSENLIEYSDFPIEAVELICQKEDRADHRWVLGSIIALGISREHIGDILPEYGSCVVICTPTVKNLLINELKKVGSLGIKVVEKKLEEIVYNQNYEYLKGTISSARIDNIVSFLTNSSRNDAEVLIKAQKVQHNYCLVEKGSKPFVVEDTITIRGYGKYIVDTIGNPTRKGRLPVQCRKYL